MATGDQATGLRRYPRHFGSVLWICAVLVPLCAAAPAAAWDSFLPSNSHETIFVHAYDEALDAIYADAALPDALADDLAWGRSEMQARCDVEDTHVARRSVAVPGPVGSNPGNTHPELYWRAAVDAYREWQQTGNEARRLAAYTELGNLIHLVEDQGCPPHAYSAEHGGLDPGSFELLSNATAYDPFYYIWPGDDHITYDHPGKNVLDAGTHYDGSQIQWRLDYGVYDWRPIGSTNLQVPAPERVVLDTSIVGAGSPDEVYIRAEYQRSDGSWGTQDFGPLSPRQWRWDRLWLNADDFAPNGEMKFFFQRRESSPFYDWWTGQLQVYVNEVSDIASGGSSHLLGPDLKRPQLAHPWQYYDWLRGWTLWATDAPYWRRYGSLSNDPQDFRFGLTWISAPNTERALLSMQWAATQQALTWFLIDAQSLLDDPGYSPDAALGSGYRVVLYNDVEYNSGGGTPEHIFSQVIACEPDSVWGIGAFVPDTATPDRRVPVLDGDYRIVPPSDPKAPARDLATLASDTLRFGKDPTSKMAGNVSSVEVRRARVTLYAGSGRSGRRIVLTSDTPSLAAAEYAFNDTARSIMVEPFFLRYLKPAGGTAGTPVMVLGYGFGSRRGALTVGGKAARISSWADGMVAAVVPAGPSGVAAVRLTHADGTRIEEPLWFHVAPALTGLSPRRGAPGSRVTLTGTGFGAKRSGSAVLFGDVPVREYLHWSSTGIQVVVPKVERGRVTVTLHTDGGVSEGLGFTVH